MLFFVRVAVVGAPRIADGELVESEHVHDTANSRSLEQMKVNSERETGNKTYPTAAMPAPNKSGLWFMQDPTKRPPFEPPLMASFLVHVYLLSTRYSAAAMKSSNPFCLLSNLPALCHFSPYSPPPRMFGIA